MPFKNIEDKRAYQREWTRKRRAEFFADKSCVVCGSKDNLQIDHLDPSLKVSHRVWNWSKERREAELAKCQVLCHTHHVEKTVRNADHLHDRVKDNWIKMTADQVREARVLYSNGGVTFRELGLRYGVHGETVRYYVTRGGGRLIA